jgi:Flp pilus assembly protein TadG
MTREKPRIRAKRSHARPGHARPGYARLRARRASVSVEFALVSLFFLFPLIAGGIDMTLVLSARSKLNSALHSLYIFAWSDPQSAADNVQLQQFIQSIDPVLPTSTINLINRPGIQNICFDSSGAIDPSALFTANPAGPGVTGPGGSGASNSTCTLNGNVVTGDIPVSIVTYNLQSVIQLPIPVPFLANPLTLTASGTIQIE